MSEEKLYAVKNDEGKYWDFEDRDDFWELTYVSCPTTYNELDAKDVVHDYGGHIVTLIEEPEKVVLTKEQAEIVDDAHAEIWPATYISGLTDSSEQRLMIEAYVNGYTVAKEKKYLVYKTLGGKQKHEYVAQAYRSSIYPGTVEWLITDEVTNGSKEPFDQFTEAEIEHYGLQDCEKEEVTDDDE
ncbi:MAG: Phage protein [Lacticaseibacillus casei]|jgi:hypothetical protein